MTWWKRSEETTRKLSNWILIHDLRNLIHRSFVQHGGLVSGRAMACNEGEMLGWNLAILVNRLETDEGGAG